MNDQPLTQAEPLTPTISLAPQVASALGNAVRAAELYAYGKTTHEQYVSAMHNLLWCVRAHPSPEGKRDVT